jgi:hypothetical protein
MLEIASSRALRSRIWYIDGHEYDELSEMLRIPQLESSGVSVIARLHSRDTRSSKHSLFRTIARIIPSVNLKCR